MAEAGGIVTVAGAFVAGIYAGIHLPHDIAVMAAPALTMPLLLLSCLRSRGRCVPQIAAIFFLLGLMRCNCETFWDGSISTTPMKRYADLALEKLTALIEKAGFGKDGEEALVKALLSGRRESLDEGTVKVFRDSGASHILALSGLHLGMIYLLLSKALSPIGNSPAGKTARSAAVVLACTFYTFTTGASPSTVRALLFITLSETARPLSGRKRSNASTFCIAIMLQLLSDPRSLLSTGFQLSYLAVTGLMTLHPILESWYPMSKDGNRNKIDIVHRIWTSASMALSCQVLTAPLVWMRFQTFPRHFLLTNLIALPLTEAIMASAVVTLVLTALDICPDFAPALTGRMGECLEYCLEVISGM